MYQKSHSALLPVAFLLLASYNSIPYRLSVTPCFLAQPLWHFCNICAKLCSVFAKKQLQDAGKGCINTSVRLNKSKLNLNDRTNLLK